MEKGKIFMIIIIALLIFVLGAIGVLAFSFFKFMNKEDSEEETAHTETAKLTMEEIEIIPLSKPINSNLLVGADDVSHIASIDFSIGINNTDKESETLIELLTTKEKVVRSVCSDAVRNKTYDELKRPDGPDILSEEILTDLREEFQSELIYQVYINDIYLE